MKKQRGIIRIDFLYIIIGCFIYLYLYLLINYGIVSIIISISRLDSYLIEHSQIL